MIDSVVLGFAAGSVSALVAALVYFLYRKNVLKKIEHSAEVRVKELQHRLENEQQEAFNKINRKRNEFEEEQKRIRFEFKKVEDRLQKKSEHIEQRESEVETIRRELHVRERDLGKRNDELLAGEGRVKKVYDSLIQKLEHLAGMNRDQARKMLTESLQNEVKHECAKWLVTTREETVAQAESKAIKILSTAMQRCIPDQVVYSTSTVVQLPSEEMKGRIIGKEGRNIKALEMATGMEFVIGESPESIAISGFNPIRREVARRALLKLIKDGRINPSRIEEVVEKCAQEVDMVTEEMGHKTVLEFNCVGMHKELVSLLGKLYFRTSYTQNNLEHSKEVAYFARMIAEELGLDGNLAARCGLLHDIGKALSADVEGPHAIIGGELAKKCGEDPIVVNAIAAHHEEVAPISPYAMITHLADALSAARPGARKEKLGSYVKRLEDLEDIANAFDGVKKAYALQAGREIRIIVDEMSMSDEDSMVLARDIVLKIQEKLDFPGQIKVTVIREKRAIEYAK
jgi:ribonuclease Y